MKMTVHWVVTGILYKEVFMKEFFTSIMNSTKWMFLNKKGLPTRTLVIVLALLSIAFIAVSLDVVNGLITSVVFSALLWLVLGLIYWSVDSKRRKS